MKKVAVIGASGMVASRFIDLAKDNFVVTPLDEKTLDITDPDKVSGFFEKNKFDTVINFAAFTNVDAAEKERGDEEGITYRLNVKGPENLAKGCNDNNIFLVHISTDFVFTGSAENPGPYEIDETLPETPEGLGWYAWTKNRAEFMLQNVSNNYAIVRYGYPFRADTYEAKLDWARNLIKLYNEQKLYPLFADQIQSVILIDDLVTPLQKIIDGQIPGVFHTVASATNTPYEIGKYLLEKYSGKSLELEKGSMSEFMKSPGRFPRPLYGGLKVEKTEEVLGVKFRTWQEMVDEFLSDFKK
jgi:dTDP-4-dehydrorhamnose reductase